MTAPASKEPMIIGNGITILKNQYLAGFKGTNYPTVPTIVAHCDHAREGTLKDLEERCPELAPVLWNDVKLCECGKPCAFTLKNCNACGRSLADTPISKSENVFAAFIFGVKMAQRGFPYKISIRRQTPDVLCFDDMLALTPCHLNCIPVRYYIPDWRFLLLNPQLGIKVLDTMEMELWAATQQFYSNEEWRRCIFKRDVTEEELYDKVIKSFNFPPSQFQLHIQWLVPPLTPFQHFQAECRDHFHHNRAFPMAYVRDILLLNEPYKVHEKTPIEQIMDHYGTRGVVYQEYWEKFYQKALDDSADLANWMVDDFSYIVEDKKVYKPRIEGSSVVKGELEPDVESVALVKGDCALIQNYGRPYADGKPSGTYNKHARPTVIGPGGLQEFPSVFS